MDRAVVAAGAAVGSTVGGFQGALIGAGIATTGIATLRLVKIIAFVGGVTYTVVKGVVRMVGGTISGVVTPPLLVGHDSEQEQDEEWTAVQKIPNHGNDGMENNDHIKIALH